MFSKRFIILSLISISLFAGCIPSKPLLTPDYATPEATATSLSSIKHQLTYVMPFELNGTQYQGIYAIEVLCFEIKTLCFDSPELLSKIPEESGENTLAPYGDISSYSWSLDGKKIAFSASSLEGKIDIFIADWNGGNLKNITMSPEREIFPSWSVDSQLMYTLCSSGRCRTIISDQYGEQKKVLPINSDTDFATWMPSGKQVLFIGADDQSINQIFVANADGSEIMQVTHATENNIVSPVSTNGSSLFFTKSQANQAQNFNYSVFSIDITGKVEKAITVDDYLISAGPAVALFRDWLAFEQGRNTYDIYVSSFDGKDAYKITDNEGDKRKPAWRVIGYP